MAKPKLLSNQLKELIPLIEVNKRGVACRLCEELCFMYETLTELKEQIKEHGTVEMFKNGKQEFMRESAALKGYNTLIRNYTACYKQLCDLLPKEVEVKPSNAVLDLMKGI